MSYVLSNVIEWSGLCEFVSDFDSPFSFKWEAKESINLPIRNGVNINFFAHVNSLPTRSTESKVTLEQEVVFQFQYSHSIKLKDSLSDIKTLIQLIDLAIQDNVYIKRYGVIKMI